MKIWFKFIVCAALGIVLGFLLPESVSGSLSWLADLAIRIGRYAVPPLLIFSLTMAFYELRRDGKLWAWFFRALLLLVGLSVLVIALGVGMTAVVHARRIPIEIETQEAQPFLDIGAMVNSLVPSNMLSVLVSDGVYLLPLCIFAMLVAAGLFHEKTAGKAIVNIVDSISRVFYRVVIFIQEILAPVMIVISAYWAVRYRQQVLSGAYGNFIFIITLTALVFALGVFPLLLMLLGKGTNPLKRAYALFSSAISSFFSGDINFSLSTLLPACGENLGVKRRVNTPSVLLFSTFCRCGSAMVAAVSFIAVIRSYSSLEVTTLELFEIGLRALIVGFLLAGHPGSAAYTALGVIATSYGEGFESYYLILKPLAFYLISVGTFLDVMIAGYATFALGKMTDSLTEKPLKAFI
jgi:Na+/H+-dicarboxylate symporter